VYVCISLIDGLNHKPDIALAKAVIIDRADQAPVDGHGKFWTIGRDCDAVSFGLSLTADALLYSLIQNIDSAQAVLDNLPILRKR